MPREVPAQGTCGHVPSWWRQSLYAAAPCGRYLGQGRSFRCCWAQLILSLVDNWQLTDGVDQIVKWSGSAKSHEDFFSDPNCMQLYRNTVAAILNRVNSINGRTCVPCAQLSWQPATPGSSMAPLAVPARWFHRRLAIRALGACQRLSISSN